MFDVVYVSYNSEKWINQCFGSWLKVDYDLSQINIFVVDNASSDHTVALLKDFEKNHGNRFGTFKILEEDSNWGFGKANNIGFSQGSADIVCFLNVDTELFEDTFLELEKEVSTSASNVGLWEFRQFPYEHPKMYDVLTGETSWSSGAAFAVKRNIFAGLNGFDEKIFLYAEDVDLSWRIRSEGYILKYVPRVKIIHYSYESAGELKPNQHIYSLVNNLLLRHRFGNRGTILTGHAMFWNHMRKPEAFPGAHRILLKEYFKLLKQIPHFSAKGRYKGKNIGYFTGWDYSMIRDGAFHENMLPKEKPLVSIIVRTCGRPSILRETLISLSKQTYDNMEIVVVEDGEAVAENMIREEFSTLNILYHPTIQKVGRSKAGNLAMGLAHGKYLNFLDDDDLFFADHVEVLVAALEMSSKRAAYATSYETPIVVESKDPYKYEIKNYLGIHKQPFNKIILCHHNYIPIQCIMFEKALFEEHGGLDETVDALEDWDMWVRYSLYTDFAFVLKTTSMYRVPAVKNINEKRQKELDDALVFMRKKHRKYVQTISVADIAEMYGRQ